MFGKLRWLAGTNKSFGALYFKHLLRNYILGCGDVIPQPKNSSVSKEVIDEDEKLRLEEEKISGFGDCTEDLVESVQVKGQLISKCPFGVIIWTNLPPKNLTNSALEWVGQNFSNFSVVNWSKQ